MLPKKALVFIAIATLFLVALFTAAIFIGHDEHTPLVTQTIKSGSDATSAVIYATSFVDLSGRPQSLGQWSNKLLVINFWASWCAPCLEEIPIFVKLQNKYGAKGLQIIGIAADSTLNSVNFAEKLKINYPVLPSESNAITFSKRTGNRLGLLPYTIVLGPQGDVILTKLGIINEAEFSALIEKNLPR